MSTDRRSFLKLFGVGAAVIPIIGGIPQPLAEAKLLEAPKVELVDDPTMVTAVRENRFVPAGRYSVLVMFQREGRTHYIQADDFQITHGVEHINEVFGAFPDGMSIGTSGTVKLKIEGLLLPNAKDDILTFYEE